MLLSQQQHQDILNPFCFFLLRKLMMYMYISLAMTDCHIHRDTVSVTRKSLITKQFLFENVEHNPTPHSNYRYILQTLIVS